MKEKLQELYLSIESSSFTNLLAKLSDNELILFAENSALYYYDITKKKDERIKWFKLSIIINRTMYKKQALDEDRFRYKYTELNLTYLGIKEFGDNYNELISSNMIITTFRQYDFDFDFVKSISDWRTLDILVIKRLRKLKLLLNIIVLLQKECNVKFPKDITQWFSYKEILP